MSTDLAGRMSYGRFLDLDRLLVAQRPVSDPEHHDESLSNSSTRRASCG